MGVRDKSLKVIRWGFVGTLIIASGASLFIATNRLVAGIFDRFRFELERELSVPLGHPLVIGPYKGLRPWGLAIGETRIKAGSKDSSSVQFSELTIKYAPIASFLNWRPVAVVSPKGARVVLHANHDGSFWVLGPTDQTPPNIAIWLRLKDPAKISVTSSNNHLTATSNSFFKLSEKQVSGSIQLSFPDRGTVLLKGNGFWDRFDMKARARLKNVRLKPLKSLFLRQPDLNAKGKLQGDLQISIREGDVDCKGGMTLHNFILNGGPFTNSLTSQKASITCSRQQVLFPLSKWEYGPLTTSFSAEIPLHKRSQLELAINSSVGLKGVSSSGLYVNAKLPLTISSQGIKTGELLANLNLKTFPLSPIGSLVGTQMSGVLSANGQVTGLLPALKTNLSLSVVNPQVSGLRLQQKWRGKLTGSLVDGGDIQMTSVGAGIPGTLDAKFDSDLSINNLKIERLGGQFLLSRDNEGFNWSANNFRLDRIEVGIPPENSFKRIFGTLSGKGNFAITPLEIDGEVTLRYPRYMGLRLKEANFKGNYIDNNFIVGGDLFPTDKGKVLINIEGTLGGRLNARAEARAVSARWIADTAQQLPKLSVKATAASGKAEDLDGFFLKAKGDSLNSRLFALDSSHLSLLKSSKIMNSKNTIFNPNDLQGDVNAVIEVEGKDIENLNLDLELSGHLWPKGQKDEIDFQGKPFVARIRGPLQGGIGKFSLLNVPFSLLSLVGPVPSSLTGMFGLSGQYRRGKGVPDVTAELTLEDARLAGKAFVLDKGDLSLSNSILRMDVFVRSTSSLQPLKLVGDVPIDPSLPIDFRVQSNGDGLRFLDGLADGTFQWKEGTADLRFFIRGTRNDPEANGYLVLKGGEIVVMDKTIKELEASMIFDFDRLELGNLQARTDLGGSIKGSGIINLFRPGNKTTRSLNLEINNVPFKISYIDVLVASDLTFQGSLLQPQIGGDLTIKNGSLSFPTQSVSINNQSKKDKNRFIRNKVISYPEQKWDWKAPLNLFVQDSDATASKILRSSIPNRFSYISFDNLKLRLGPNLQISTPPNAITLQPLATFQTAGLLTLNGALDQTLKAQGFLRLIKGRVNLFTATLTLDRNQDNVVLFTKRMGLIPFVDITMKTNVSDTVKSVDNLASSSESNNVEEPPHVASNQEPSSDFTSNGSGAFGIGGTRSIAVEVVVTGPADRISENLKITSRPPIPRSQLIGLLGGNSLTSLFGGGQGVVGDVIGRSFISPLLGNVSDSFDDRLQVSLYPTTIVSSPKGAKENTGNKAETTDTQEQAWVTDVGYDLNKRFNISVQAIPNRSDIPPQGTLRYSVNSNLDALGSLDNEGNWQSQFQIILKY